MQIEQVNRNKLVEWILGVNAAFKARESKQIPYEPITIESVLKKNRTCFACIDDEGIMVGGFSFAYDLRMHIVTIGNIWVMPEHQGKGISNCLVEYAEERARELNATSIQLIVANIYKPAVNLYAKHGFAAVEVCANVPGTYYLIRMMKYLQPCGVIAKLKRNLVYYRSLLIFFFLYKPDSSPGFGYKIYKILKSRQYDHCVENGGEL